MNQCYIWIFVTAFATSVITMQMLGPDMFELLRGQVWGRFGAKRAQVQHAGKPLTLVRPW